MSEAYENCRALNERMGGFKTSQFDFVLDQNASQKKVYDKIGVGDMVKAVVEVKIKQQLKQGYHGTIFAYGQTGSGKTFSMEDNGDNIGIVPRSIHHLFEQIKIQNSLQNKKYRVYCSFFQVYKEKIYDLLNKSEVKKLINDGPGLKLKWTKHDQFTVENLFTYSVTKPEEILSLYHFGLHNKVVASHNMNNSSSRSHSVLCIMVEQIDMNQPDNVIVSKLQLVDLAGSERMAFTGQVANKESIEINKSLFTLRQVINALNEKQKNPGVNAYVPYRESKLTCLLKQSLGGNSYCLMLACLNPCDQYIEENLNTLQYAQQASIISNKPVKNEDPKTKLIDELKMQVKSLTEQLQRANETIEFLSQVTANGQGLIGENFKYMQNYSPGTNPIFTNQSSDRQNTASSGITEKR